MNHSDQPKTSLFVGDLSSYCSEEDLHQAFALYGVVKHVRVQRTKDKRSGHKTTAGYGFVKMWTADQASAAMSALDGTVIAGRKVRIRYATYHAEDTVKNESRVSLYLKFVATTPASNTNEDRIRQIYSQFGEVEDVTIRKQFVNSRHSIKRGYAFVHYADTMDGLEAALRVLTYFPLIIHNPTTNDFKFDVAELPHGTSPVTGFGAAAPKLPGGRFSGDAATENVDLTEAAADYMLYTVSPSKSLASILLTLKEQEETQQAQLNREHPQANSRTLEHERSTPLCAPEESVSSTDPVSTNDSPPVGLNDHAATEAQPPSLISLYFASLLNHEQGRGVGFGDDEEDTSGHGADGQDILGGKCHGVASHSQGFSGAVRNSSANSGSAHNCTEETSFHHDPIGGFVSGNNNSSNNDQEKGRPNSDVLLGSGQGLRDSGSNFVCGPVAAPLAAQAAATGQMLPVVLRQQHQSLLQSQLMMSEQSSEFSGHSDFNRLVAPDESAHSASYGFSNHSAHSECYSTNNDSLHGYASSEFETSNHDSYHSVNRGSSHGQRRSGVAVGSAGDSVGRVSGNLGGGVNLFPPPTPQAQSENLAAIQRLQQNLLQMQLNHKAEERKLLEQQQQLLDQMGSAAPPQFHQAQQQAAARINSGNHSSSTNYSAQVTSYNFDNRFGEGGGNSCNTNGANPIQYHNLHQAPRQRKVQQQRSYVHGHQAYQQQVLPMPQQVQTRGTRSTSQIQIESSLEAQANYPRGYGSYQPSISSHSGNYSPPSSDK